MATTKNRSMDPGVQICLVNPNQVLDSWEPAHPLQSLKDFTFWIPHFQAFNYGSAGVVEISDRFFSNFVQMFSKTWRLQKWKKNGGHRANCCTMLSGSWVTFAGEIRRFLMVTSLIWWHSALPLISKTVEKLAVPLEKVRLGLNGLYCQFSTTLPPPNSPRTSIVCSRSQSRLLANL